MLTHNNDKMLSTNQFFPLQAAEQDKFGLITVIENKAPDIILEVTALQLNQ